MACVRGIKEQHMTEQSQTGTIQYGILATTMQVSAKKSGQAASEDSSDDDVVAAESKQLSTMRFNIYLI